GVDDVRDGRATGQVVDRLVQALQNRSDRQGVRRALHRLVGDVSTVQVGEDEDVGLARHVRFRHLLLANGGDGSGVELQWAVQLQVRVVCLRLLDGGGDGLDVLARTGGAGGVGQHRDLRVDAELGGRLRGHRGDLGELLGGRVRVVRAVTEGPQVAVHDHEED